MKFTLSWLKDHLETDATLDEIVEKLTMIGLEVEDVDGLYEQLVADGFVPIVPICDEPWGQRHFIIRDPGGTFVDVVKSIPPSEEYADAFND